MKNLLTVVIGLFCAVALSKCDGVEQVNSQSQKSMWSYWVSEDGSEEFDLTGGVYGEWMDFVVENDEVGEYCEMEIIFTLPDAMSITNDSCGIYNGSYTFRLTGNKLTLCYGADCYDYY